MLLFNWQKTLDLLKANGITYQQNRDKAIINESLLTKMKKCSSDYATSLNRQDFKLESEYQKALEIAREKDFDKIKQNLQEYKDWKGTDFKYHVSTASIEDLCNKVQCSPLDLFDYRVELDPSKSFEFSEKKNTRFRNTKNNKRSNTNE